ncbi:MAG TPA: hypothetical protein VJX67_15395, partial [Blastocatellia bacterium]|nr:hypothetical protein [Blastocatellia bacterium]
MVYFSLGLHTSKMTDSGNKALITSHDAESRVRAAVEWLNSFPHDTELLVLGPTREAIDEVARAAAVSAGARFGLKRFTLDSLAGWLAAPVLASAGRSPASHLGLIALVARAVHSLLAVNALSYYGRSGSTGSQAKDDLPVAALPGFPIAAARTIEELRMNQVEAKRLRSIHPNGSDLAVLL